MEVFLNYCKKTKRGKKTKKNGYIFTEKDVNEFHIPTEKLPKSSAIRFHNKKTGKKRIVKCWSDKTILNIMKTMSHPHIYDIQIESKLKSDHRNKHEMRILAKICKKIGYTGFHNESITLPDGKKYRPDYYYPDSKGNPLILIEVDEAHHTRVGNQVCDELRQEELSSLYGDHFYRINYDIDKINDNELDLICEEIKMILEYCDDDISIERMKNEFKDFTQVETFAEKFGLCMIDETNAFPFNFNEAKKLLQITPNSEIEKRVMSYFVDKSTKEEKKPEDKPEADSSDSSEDESEGWSNEEDEFKNVEEDVEEKTTTIFTKDIDYEIIDGKIFVNRKTFVEIALKTDTKTGKLIFDQYWKFQEMLSKLFDIIKKRSRETVHLVNQQRIERAYKERVSLPFKLKLTKLEKEIKRLKKSIAISKKNSTP